MKKVMLSIPHLKEGPCCSRARWLRQFGWRLNLSHAAICIAEIIAMAAWDKTLPFWTWYIRFPVLFIIFAILFFNHRLATWLKFIPESPDSNEALNNLSAFPKERRDEAAAPQRKDKNGPTL